MSNNDNIMVTKYYRLKIKTHNIDTSNVFWQDCDINPVHDTTIAMKDYYITSKTVDAS